jgi:hypothetical protein
MGTAANKNLIRRGRFDSMARRWQGIVLSCSRRTTHGRSHTAGQEAIKAGTADATVSRTGVYLPSPDGQRFLVNAVMEPCGPHHDSFELKRPAVD